MEKTHPPSMRVRDLVTLENELVAKINIPKGHIKNIEDLVFREKGSSYKDFIITEFIKWLNTQSPRYRGTHAGECQDTWIKLHPDM